MKSNRMFDRIIDFPKGKSCFLFGPRGTGKSFWLNRQFKECVYIDLLEAEIEIIPEGLSHKQRLFIIWRDKTFLRGRDSNNSI